MPVIVHQNSKGDKVTTTDNIVIVLSVTTTIRARSYVVPHVAVGLEAYSSVCLSK